MTSSCKENERKDEHEIKSSNSFLVIFRHADRIDMLLMLLGTLGAIGDGMSTNCILVFVSDIMNSLGYGGTQRGNDDFMHVVEKLCMCFIYVALAVWLTGFLEGYCWSKTSERQITRIRHVYLEAVLRQEVGFFDMQGSGGGGAEVVNSLSKDTSLIQEILNEKVPLLIVRLSEFFSGIAFSFYFSWRLALAAFPLLILLVIPGIVIGKYVCRLSQKSHSSNGEANSIVEQALTTIRTLYSYTLENKTVQQYSCILNGLVKVGIRQGLIKGIAVGCGGIVFSVWAFVAWYGCQLVTYRGESGGRIYASGITFILAGLALGLALADMQRFTEASVAASNIFRQIDRIPTINDSDSYGVSPKIIHGDIEFENVSFAYPTRPTSMVLRGFNLVIPAGKTIAIVGQSGCGKSTLVALLQRFYDVHEGEVRIDGLDIKSLQLKWLRGKMALVSQDHALFGTTIRENIMFGKPNATIDEVYAAAMAANAHDFIRKLPNGYETKIGELGSQLSGGQKQRISIARALIRNPPILLLDEATSALDIESEKMVQSAIDQASMGRTTIIISHKLSAIKNADQIVVIDNGIVAETGSHKELINRSNGVYAHLEKLQKQNSVADQEHNPTFMSSITSSAGRISASSTPRSQVPRSPPKSTKTKHHLHAVSLRKLIQLSLPEWKQGVAGSLSAILSGAVHPIFAFTIGAMIAAFFAPIQTKMKSLIQEYSIIFVSLSVIYMLASVTQYYFFAQVGEMLTKRVRVRLMEKILTFEVGWFDEEENSTAAVCSALSKEAPMVKSLIADRISLVLHTLSAVAIAMVMGLVIAWKLALVMIVVQPLTILCFYLRKVTLSHVSSDSIKSQNQSTQIALEAVYNHKIITSYSSVDKVMQLYAQSQEASSRVSERKSLIAGMAIGSCQSITFLTWALDFWFGGKLVKAKEITAGDVFKTFFIIIRTGKMIGEAGSMTSDLSKGSRSVASVFAMLDRPSKISSQEEQKNLKLEKIVGAIDMKDVEFSYPVRPQTIVLSKFSLKVKSGTSIGLVGRSGSGKSTVLSLIQRFYDVNNGYVRIDGHDIRELDLAWYRKFTGLVSQEPVLYSGSIRENILIGRPDASEAEMIDAAVAANAHNFISSLKDGYATECGTRGVQLSGGQKQRIAIARAIIRNPAIMLLDEATSALDAESEHLVQEALDLMMVGRTTMVVAHHLNTLNKVDFIAVIDNGKVMEYGTHAQLRSKKGAFFELSRLQHDHDA